MPYSTLLPLLMPYSVGAGTTHILGSESRVGQTVFKDLRHIRGCANACRIFSRKQRNLIGSENICQQRSITDFEKPSQQRFGHSI